VAAVVLLAIGFAFVVVSQVRALNSANDAVAEVHDNHDTVGQLSRRVDRIENAVWHNWATTGRFQVDEETFAFGVATAREAAAFYGARAKEGSPVEADVARKMLSLTERGGRLLGAARSGPSGPAGQRLARQVAAFSLERGALREQWLVENASAEDVAMAEARRRTNTLLALLAAGLISLAVAGVALGVRMRREREASMRRLRQTADEMAALASTDPLTGLGNQRLFYARLDAELRRALQADQPLALALVDVDNFKLVNDEHGHLIGDQVLLEVARRIEAGTASVAALTSRVGGEEFAVVMPGTAADVARSAAERMRTAIEEPIVPVGRVTVSIGLTVARTNDDVVALFKRSDTALYRAKREGKNRVVAHDDPPGASPPRPSTEAAARPQALEALRSLVGSVDEWQSMGGHSGRVARFAVQIARMAGWGPQDVARLRQAALLHDVGKVVVPPGVLSKPGRLTDGERSLISVHPAVGSEMVRRTLDHEQASWVLHHHERWDGGGYPHGLMGEQIPEGARILAIADAWDAMTSERVYAPALTSVAAMVELRACRGSQFWPTGVDLVLEVVSRRPAGPDLVSVPAK
jgi:diguanylate cyclase (GGDEF)-like protein